ncbi:hypothetical protein [Thorsellia anophelis]|uniref:hypothetical protein n=1 Tax=Thorsellia anophelis TaxID=336804 RepID=UPI00115FB2E6|nr:hypothetical protein [Thorsellia anophelis]
MSISCATYPSLNTYGYALTLPNRFWPNTFSSMTIENQILHTTATNNSDVCFESQVAGYRLPTED